MGAKPYDPLDYDNLAASVVRALMDQAPEGLPPVSPFLGAGVYAIYHVGRHPLYAAINDADCRCPIYVGKADPSGGRKGGAELVSTGRELRTRLKQHADSIEAAHNLELVDFRCRYLVVQPVWIALAERFLLSHYRPVWNTVVDGFGNHDPGKGRRAGVKPRWDILHPGRSWAERHSAAESAESVEEAVRQHLHSLTG